jgi:hypothetical protein
MHVPQLEDVQGLRVSKQVPTCENDAEPEEVVTIAKCVPEKAVSLYVQPRKSQEVAFSLNARSMSIVSVFTSFNLEV